MAVLPEMTSLALSWIAVVAVIWTFSGRIDSILSRNRREALAKAIHKSSAGEILSSAAKAFSIASDALFGKSILSMRSFFVSVLCSVFALIFLSLIWFSKDERIFGILRAEGIVRQMPYLFVFLNILPDYLSVIETRFLLRLSRHISNFFGLLSILFADLLAKLLIYTAGWYVWIMFVVLPGMTSNEFHRSYFKLFGEVLEQVSSFGPKFVNGGDTFYFPSFLAIFAYTTLLSSVWIWLYVLAIGITQIAKRADSVWNPAKIWLDLDEKPALWLGAIAIVLVSLFYVVYALVGFLAAWI
jgi:hypothetical protein